MRIKSTGTEPPVKEVEQTTTPAATTAERQTDTHETPANPGSLFVEGSSSVRAREVQQQTRLQPEIGPRFDKAVRDLIAGAPTESVSDDLLHAPDLTLELASLLLDLRPELFPRLRPDQQADPTLLDRFINSASTAQGMVEMAQVAFGGERLARDTDLLRRVMHKYSDLCWQQSDQSVWHEPVSKDALAEFVEALSLESTFSDEEFLIQYGVPFCSHALDYGPPAGLADPDVALSVLQRNPFAANKVPAELATDPSFQSRVADTAPNAFRCWPSVVQPEVFADPERAGRLTAIFPDILERVGSPLNADPTFVRAALLHEASFAGAAGELRDSLELARVACAMNGKNYAFCSQRLRATPDFALTALTGFHDTQNDMWQVASEVVSNMPAELMTNEFLRQAVEVNPAVAAFFDPGALSEGNTRDFFIELARTYSPILYVAPPELLEDPDVFRAAASCGDASGLYFMSPSLWENDALVTDILEHNPSSFLFFPPEAQTPERILAFAEETGDVVPRPDGASFENPELALRLLAANARAVEFISPELLSDDAFLARAVGRFPPLLRHLPAHALPASVLAYLHPHLEEKCAQIEEELAELGITNAMRLANLEVLRRVVATRTQPPDPDDPRPVAVVVHGSDDWNGAFYVNDIDRLVRHYRTYYYEVDTEQEYVAAVKEATQSKPARLLINGGHGSRDAMALGSPDPARVQVPWEETMLDLSDESELVREELWRCVEPDGNVVQKSCSNARGRDKLPNMGNMMGVVYRGRNVWSTTVPANNGVVLDDGGEFVDPGYYSGPVITYRVKLDDPVADSWLAHTENARRPSRDELIADRNALRAELYTWHDPLTDEAKELIAGARKREVHP